MNFLGVIVVVVCAASVMVFGSNEEIHIRHIRVTHERRRKMHFVNP
jgi:hypothetical protein